MSRLASERSEARVVSELRQLIHVQWHEKLEVKIFGVMNFVKHYVEKDSFRIACGKAAQMVHGPVNDEQL